ncbi:hypothetical protein GCM10020331_061600 [Ectobacillus funiculus]
MPLFSRQRCEKRTLRLFFTVNQALLAARAGATYVSPFLGRLDDISEDGVQLVAKSSRAIPCS